VNLEKQKLESEILSMQSEFLEICDKLSDIQDKDNLINNLQNENIIINSSLKSKTSEYINKNNE